MYDYIIVGAGSAGCVLANRLSADPAVNVLLLEAGGPDRNPLIHFPGGMFALLQQGLCSWTYPTAPQRHLDNRVLYDVRGKVLGGSSSINGMIYCRGAAADYDRWRALGNEGWSYADVLPYFKRAESHQHGASEFHGGDGPLQVTRSALAHPLARAWVEAAVQAGHRYNDDINGAVRDGFGPSESTASDGRRRSAASAYLRPARSRPNLTVITRALVTRILFKRTRAVGVEYTRAGSVESRRAYTTTEVILSGGTINSPHLLLLSGVGAADELRRFDIAPVLQLPGVGKNLHDHFGFSVQVACPLPVSDFRHLHPLAAAAAVGRYLLFRRGPLAAPPVEAVGIVSSRTEDSALPDLKFQLIPLLLDANGRTLLRRHGVMIRIALTRPRSRGELTLRSADPRAAPWIDANYLAEERDRLCARAAVKIARDIFRQPAYADYCGDEVAPGPAVHSDAAIDAFLRRTGQCDMHSVGTCSMGTGPDAVVDARLRVHGAEGLRVVDASIMPEVVSGNTNAPTIMIAEKAADMILGIG